MFEKILIANRGEIACRIIRTCCEMGVKTVAVYSDADAGALHVALADEAVHLGGAEASDSYLNIEKILDAVKKTGAKAVHPGYGFLSENTKFAKALEEAGIVFIGPSSHAIEVMGDKSTSKKTMETAGVPLVPGYHGDDQDEKLLQAEADKIGYPVLIKASAGGGGKGMVVVEKTTDFKDGLASAKRTAQSAFGNDHVLIEKYVGNPRHVEVQVFGDTQGNVIHLFERDCSIQRRHQKVVEEAPAPNLSQELRDKMGKAACDAARAIDYVGAGTVEFLLDEEGGFYFMEMNTRLQVEHPVTECITGQDLVEWQLLVASGQALPLSQTELNIDGHAIEVRLYAEDPDHDFLPAAGDISYLRWADEDGLRIDTGVREALWGHGDTVSVYYDPMIAKVIVHADNRSDAVEKMQQVLSQIRLAGIKTNLRFLERIIGHSAFKQAELSTHFIATHEKDLLPTSPNASQEQGDKVEDHVLVMAALGILADRQDQNLSYNICDRDPTSPWHDMSAWRQAGGHREQMAFTVNDQDYIVGVKIGTDGVEVVPPSGQKMTTWFESSGYDLSLDMVLDDVMLNATVIEQDGAVTVMTDGLHRELFWRNPVSQNASADAGQSKLTAPMPGRVVAVHVAKGASVEKGQPLIIVEAMKMEHTITAPADGVVMAVNTNVGDQVDDKLELVSFQ